MNLRLSIIILSFCILSACSIIRPYKFDIPQGNDIEQSKLDQLEIGMTPKQVAYLLGSPSIKDPFQQSRWDYVYHLTDKNRKITMRRVTIEFAAGKVIDIRDSKASE